MNVSDNTFELPRLQTSEATAPPANGCGYNGLFSEYGTTAPYTAWVVPKNIADNQNNHFSDNTYTGPWSFMGPDLGVDSDVGSVDRWLHGQRRRLGHLLRRPGRGQHVNR